MKDKGTLKSLVLVWIPLFLLYFSSELVLRIFYVQGGNDKEELEALANKLPGFMRDSFKARQRHDDTRKTLNEAINTKDKKSIIKAYYEHAMELDEDDRIELYKEMLAAYPNEFECGRAFIDVMAEESNKYNYDTFLAYIEKFEKWKQGNLLQQAWYKIRDFSDDKVKNFTAMVMKQKYETGQFYLIYGDLKSMAFKLKLPIETEDVLEGLKNKCLKKYQRMVEQQKKQQQSPEGLK